MATLLRWLTFWRFRPAESRDGDSRALYWIFVTLLLALVPGAYELVTYLSRVSTLTQERLKLGRQKIESVASQVEQLRSRVEKLATDVARDLESGALQPEMVGARLQTDSDKASRLLGMAVAFRPHAYSPQQRLFAPFYDTRTGKIRQIEEKLDYTDFQHAAESQWHLVPMLRKAPAWTVGSGGLVGEPYLQYAVPFFQALPDGAHGRCLGTIHAVLSLKTLTYLLNKENVGRLGSGFLLGSKGILLAHPIAEHVDGRRSLLDVSRAMGKPGMTSIAEQVGNSPEGSFEIDDRTTEQKMLCLFRTIPETDWKVGMVVYQEELYGYDRALRHKQIHLALCILCIITGLSGLGFRCYHLRSGRLWGISLGFAAMALLTLSFIWSLALQQSARERREVLAKQTVSDTVLIDDLQSLKGIIDQHQREATRLSHAKPAIIPTGIFITAVEPQGGNRVNISGTVWQRYHVRDHKDIQRGIVLPDTAPDPEALSIEQAFTQQEGEHEIVGWRFRVSLRLSLNYSLYPLDFQQLGVRIQHPEMGRTVLLVPDLDNYERISTNHRPGLSREIVLTGWQIEGSYFTYESIGAGTSFGLSATTHRSRGAQLQFNVLTRREIVTPFLSHIFPILVVTALLYGTLISSSGNEKRNTVSGFSTFGVLETCGAFFFAIVLVHIDLRAQLQTDVITYLESLHLILYAQLLVVAINVMLFTSKRPPAFLAYGENLSAKLLYWPLTLGLTLLVTVKFFY